MFYVSLMVTTEHKCIIDAQEMKRKESKHTTTENHQITKEENKRGRKEQWTKNNQKSMNKRAIVSSYLSIICLNVNGLNSKRQSG